MLFFFISLNLFLNLPNHSQVFLKRFCVHISLNYLFTSHATCSKDMYMRHDTCIRHLAIELKNACLISIHTLLHIELRNHCLLSKNTNMIIDYQ